MITQKQITYNNSLLQVKPSTSYDNPRTIVPVKLIHPVLEYEHTVNNFNHPGISQLYSILKQKYFWIYMQHDVKTFVNSCPTCQFGKGSKKHKHGTLNPIISQERGEIVHFDFAGPFYKDFSILVMIDNFTGAVVLQPCYNQSAEAVVFALLHVWFPIHGIPKQILTDRGKCFISAANQQACIYILSYIYLLDLYK